MARNVVKHHCRASTTVASPIKSLGLKLGSGVAFLVHEVTTELPQMLAKVRDVVLTASLSSLSSTTATLSVLTGCYEAAERGAYFHTTAQF